MTIKKSKMLKENGIWMEGVTEKEKNIYRGAKKIYKGGKKNIGGTYPSKLFEVVLDIFQCGGGGETPNKYLLSASYHLRGNKRECE